MRVESHDDQSGFGRKDCNPDESPYRILFETAGDAILLMRAERFVDCNARTLDVFGCTRDQILGSLPSQFSPVLQPDGVASAFKESEKIALARSGIPQFFEWEHTKADGTPFLAEISLNAVNIGGETLVQAIVRDVTDRRKVEHNLKRLNRFYSLLYSVNEIIIRSRSRQDMYEKICRACVRNGLLKAAAVVSFDCRMDRIVPVAQFGMDDAFLRLVGAENVEPHKHCRDILDAMKDTACLVINDTAGDPLYIERLRGPSVDRGYLAMALVPLRFGGEVVATLNIYAGEADYFESDELVLLKQMGNDVSFALETIFQADELRKSYERMRLMFEQTTGALAAALEKRDPYTAGHQQRVADLAVAIATEMNLPLETQDCVRVSAVLHDIGKIGVPAEILTKPGVLSDMEIGLIRMHAEFGWEILKDLTFPWPVAEVVRQHHERLDGTGYPRGLEERDILLEARIICVADVVETMASYRPYRAALGLEAALREIEQFSGICYDPVVVGACLKVFRENGFTFGI